MDVGPVDFLAPRSVVDTAARCLFQPAIRRCGQPKILSFPGAPFQAPAKSLISAYNSAEIRGPTSRWSRLIDHQQRDRELHKFKTIDMVQLLGDVRKI